MENFALLKEDSFEESLGEILQVNPKNEKHTILLVDDEVNNLQLLRRTLRHDYNILTASNGKEALEIVEGKGSDPYYGLQRAHPRGSGDSGRKARRRIYRRCGSGIYQSV